MKSRAKAPSRFIGAMPSVARRCWRPSTPEHIAVGALSAIIFPQSCGYFFLDAFFGALRPADFFFLPALRWAAARGDFLAGRAAFLRDDAFCFFAGVSL